MGQSFESLPPVERARRYREMASVALKHAETLDAAARASLFSMAASWQALALEIEHSAATDQPPKAVKPDPDGEAKSA